MVGGVHGHGDDVDSGATAAIVLAVLFAFSIFGCAFYRFSTKPREATPMTMGQPRKDLRQPFTSNKPSPDDVRRNELASQPGLAHV